MLILKPPPDLLVLTAKIALMVGLKYSCNSDFIFCDFFFIHCCIIMAIANCLDHLKFFLPCSFFSST